MAQCNLCNTASRFISKELGVCLKCIRERPEDALALAVQAHARSRATFGLPEKPPKDPLGIPCTICVNECRIPENEIGYCGLRKNEGGKITGVSSEKGNLSWYHDSLPTNCVGDFICPGGTGAGYPQYAHCPGPEFGYKNLAVFFHGCSFNCLYCQNWQSKREAIKPYTTSISNLVSDVDERTSCICYFGGDPTPQLSFSLKASRLALDKNKGKILRICWETNGSMHQSLLDEMIEIALSSGGCIKFDLKAWDKNLHTALTGITNKRTLENFMRAGKKINKRPVPPLLIASTLLVPGYIDEDEIRGIAKFIASINPDIPYSLLAFHPQFYMSDMPLTEKVLAYRYLSVAKEEGLENVRIGNAHLLV
ncbi:MAG: radical SAM protein [Syntrophales bacterium]|nr:radical SAM protein [Syntrophales bacterium]